jgi:hypothetical protein
MLSLFFLAPVFFPTLLLADGSPPSQTPISSASVGLISITLNLNLSLKAKPST